jgi:ribosomal protein S18 acetylase RimI-like enzyme
MNVDVRLAKSSDLPAYTRMLQKVFEATYVDPALGLEKEHFSSEIFQNEHSQKYLASNLVQRDKQGCWLAFDGGKLIGAITITNNGEECEVKGFYVAQDFQGRGVGKKLWHEALQFAEGKDIVLDTYVHNTKTIELYTKWGLVLDTSRGENGYFYRHWPEWPEGLQAKCLYMRLRQTNS